MQTMHFFKAPPTGKKGQWSIKSSFCESAELVMGMRKAIQKLPDYEDRASQIEQHMLEMPEIASSGVRKKLANEVMACATFLSNMDMTDPAYDELQDPREKFIKQGLIKPQNNISLVTITEGWSDIFQTTKDLFNVGPLKVLKQIKAACQYKPRQ